MVEYRDPKKHGQGNIPGVNQLTKSDGPNEDRREVYGGPEDCREEIDTLKKEVEIFN